MNSYGRKNEVSQYQKVRVVVPSLICTRVIKGTAKVRSAEFEKRNIRVTRAMNDDVDFRKLSRKWLHKALEHEYCYHFNWLGLPIIQFPADVLIMQEIVWKVQPDLIVDVGIARGGSVIFYSSLIALMGNGGRVIGVDVDIRNENREAICDHPLFKKGGIELLEGSSTSDAIIYQIELAAKKSKKVIVVLDSNHTKEHVMAELRRYSTFVSNGSYLVVFDTVIEDIPAKFSEDRPWGPGNNPSSAVDAFLSETDRFERDATYEEKALITAAPRGFLKRIR